MVCSNILAYHCSCVTSFATVDVGVGSVESAELS